MEETDQSPIPAIPADYGKDTNNPALSPNGISEVQEVQTPESRKLSTSSGRKDSYKVEERTQMWKQRMDQKVKEVREFKKSKELDGCTFHPALVSDSSKSITGGVLRGSKKSYEKYLQRMKNVRASKEVKSQKAQMVPGSGTF